MNDWSFFYIWEKEIPEHICDEIVSEASKNSYNKGIAGSSNKKATRNVDMQFNTSRWINALLFGYIKYANSANFNYELSDSDYEPMQISRYESGQYYNSHIDFSFSKNNPSFTRKLSLSLQISNEDQYEGGDLLLTLPDKELKVSRKKGTIIIFDSRLIHRVTEVTTGVRYSAVKWAHGDSPLK